MNLTPIFDPAQPVYIIGGGASLADFNWKRLVRKQCIAVNTAYRTVPWATVMLFSDRNFFDQHKDGVGQHFWRFKGERIVTTNPAYAGGRIEYLDPATLRIEEFSAAETNTGVKAIVLAHLLGARRIVLLGFDNAPGHWHDGTYLAHRFRVAPAVYGKYGDDIARLSRLGLDIVNANESSALTCFPIVPRDSVF